MAAKRDPYAVLGVERSASDADVRSAYRKLARKLHPDVNPGDAAAEEQFKELSAAYDVLSNAEKRKLFDEFGDDGLRGGFDPEQARSYQQWSEARSASPQSSGMPFDFDLEDLLGGVRGRRAGMAGEDIRARVELDFVTALRGTMVEVRVPVRSACPTCAGSGDDPGSKPETCPVCHGSGKQQVVNGPMRMTVACRTCGGDGKVHHPCHTCHGLGLLDGESQVQVRIPAGADDGSELRVRGKGGPGLGGGPPGDLLIQTVVRPHAHFRRSGLDLTVSMPISISEAYLGASIQVPTLDGTVQMKVPPGTSSGAKLRLRGKGVLRGKEHGDLFVELVVKLPDQRDEQLAEALRDTDKLYSAPLREGIAL